MKKLFLLAASLLLVATQIWGQQINLLVPQKKGAAPQAAASDVSARRAERVAHVWGTTPPADATRPVTYSYGDEATPAAAASSGKTTMTVNGAEKSRAVKRGVGVDWHESFVPINELHYVQFNVYCCNTPVTAAPPVAGCILGWHAESRCTSGEVGALYMVKGYASAEEARAAVAALRASGIDCWYNASLTGVALEILGVFPGN